MNFYSNFFLIFFLIKVTIISQILELKNKLTCYYNNIEVLYILEILKNYNLDFHKPILLSYNIYGYMTLSTDDFVKIIKVIR